MSIAFLHPVLDALRARGFPEELLARQLSITGAGGSDPGTMLLADKVYDFLGWATTQTGDPWLCARIGQAMARGGWAPVNALLSKRKTLWGFLRMFSIMANEQGGAATYRLEVEGHIALWKLTRRQGASRSARYADAMATGFFVELLTGSSETRTPRSECVAIAPDVSLIPDDILPHSNVIAGARGLSLRFPSDWLDLPVAEISPLPDLPDPGLPEVGITSFRECVQRLIEENLPDPEFGLAKIADALGLPVWKVQKALGEADTNVARLRNDVRLQRASELLVDSEDSVGEIADKLGYSSPSNFSRAFKARMGVSPVAYRSKGARA